jgi:hypothetical protein
MPFQYFLSSYKMASLVCYIGFERVCVIVLTSKYDLVTYFLGNFTYCWLYICKAFHKSVISVVRWRRSRPDSGLVLFRFSWFSLWCLQYDSQYFYFYFVKDYYYVFVYYAHLIILYYLTTNTDSSELIVPWPIHRLHHVKREV